MWQHKFKVFNMKVLLVLCLLVYVGSPIEIKSFLEKVDKALTDGLKNPSPLNTTQLIQDVAAYSYNLGRLNKLFSLKRESIMPAAKYMYEIKCPHFLALVNTTKIKDGFEIDDKTFLDLQNTINKIQRSVSLFFKQWELNKNFTSVPQQNRTFNTLESVDDKILNLFKNPDPSEKVQMMKYLSLYYYLLGKFIKQFKLGRETTMPRAKALWEAKVPNFYSYADIEGLSIGYKLQRDETALFRNSIYNIKDRFDDLMIACKQNINFEFKVDYSSVFLLIRKDKQLKEMVFSPDPYYKPTFLKSIKSLYHLLGFLKRHNLRGRRELYNKVREFYQDKPLLFLRKKINTDELQNKFGLTNEETEETKDFIKSIGNRFDEFRDCFMNVTNININIL